MALHKSDSRRLTLEAERTVHDKNAISWIPSVFGHRASPLPEGVMKIMRIFTLAAVLIVWSATSLAETTNFVLSLDGSSYATIQDSANAQSDAQITVEAWVNPVGGGSLINKGDGQ